MLDPRYFRQFAVLFLLVAGSTFLALRVLFRLDERGEHGCGSTAPYFLYRLHTIYEPFFEREFAVLFGLAAFAAFALLALQPSQTVSHGGVVGGGGGVVLAKPMSLFSWPKGRGSSPIALGLLPTAGGSGGGGGGGGLGASPGPSSSASSPSSSLKATPVAYHVSRGGHGKARLPRTVFRGALLLICAAMTVTLGVILGMYFAMPAVPKDYLACTTLPRNPNSPAPRGHATRNGQLQPPSAAAALATKKPTVDVFIPALKPTCVNKAVVLSVIDRLAPRRLTIISAARHCPMFREYHDSVECLDENTVIPGVTYQSLARYFDERLGASNGEFKGKNLAGWYLQQFLKMNVARTVPNVTSHYLIWDSDMIMTKNFRPWTYDGRTRIHIGGAFSPEYAETFFRQTGLKMLYSKDWSSFVCHHLVVYRPFMLELLDSFEAYALGTLSPAQRSAHDSAGWWVWATLDGIPDADILLGFSEYGSYVSWLLHNHRDTVRVLMQQKWDRYPSFPTVNKGICCPTPSFLDATYNEPSLEYVGIELGHLKTCNFDAPQYRDHYP